jgi:hypothetical protein
MGWTIWLWLAASLAGLYGLGMVLYRLFLSGKSLVAAVSESRRLLTELKSFAELEITAAKPNTREDLGAVLMARRAFEKDREAKAEARQRRLIKRISHIEIDKR